MNQNPDPVGFAVMTVSDTRDTKTDKTGPWLREQITAEGHAVIDHAIVHDEIELIQSQLRTWIADKTIHAIIATGGTGLTGRDVTPEAVRPLFEKEVDGFNVVWHMVSYQSVGLSTLQSRACAGVANATFVFCLPGSNGACKDGWDNIIRWQLDRRHRPCNLVDLMPRLTEV